MLLISTGWSTSIYFNKFLFGKNIRFKEKLKDFIEAFCIPLTQFQFAAIFIFHYCTSFVKTKKPILVHYCWPTSTLYSYLTGFSIVFFFSVPGSNTRCHIAFNYHVSVDSGCLWVSQTFLDFSEWLWQFWRILVKHLAECSPMWFIYFMIGLRFSEEIIPQRWSALLITLYPGIHMTSLTILG